MSHNKKSQSRKKSRARKRKTIPDRQFVRFSPPPDRNLGLLIGLSTGYVEVTRETRSVIMQKNIDGRNIDGRKRSNEKNKIICSDQKQQKKLLKKQKNRNNASDIPWAAEQALYQDYVNEKIKQIKISRINGKPFDGKALKHKRLKGFPEMKNIEFEVLLKVSHIIINFSV